MRHQIHMIIKGSVQGVFFRAYSQNRALSLGLTGWVHNLPDGSVEIVAEGERPKLEEFERWCQDGSPAATVEAVETQWNGTSGKFSTFSIKY